MLELTGIALITGAGSGIGRSTALAFAKAGCSGLSLIDRNAEGLSKTKSQIEAENANVKVVLFCGDVTDAIFIDRAVQGTVGEFGRLDYAVNSAGTMGPSQSSQEISLEEHDRVMNINYRGTFICAKAEAGAMLRNSRVHSGKVLSQRGAIVNIASALGIVAMDRAPAYCASKGAIIALTRADAVDYSCEGIRVNCICPGLIETPLSTLNGNAEVIKMMEPVRDMAPMKRWGQPEEIANAAVFLCSKAASFVQGHALVVDGGFP